MKKTEDIYRSKEFAEAWDSYFAKQPDLLRSDLMYPILFKDLEVEGKTVLDAGCGNGVMLPELMAKKPKSISAFDISPYLIDIAKKRYPSVAFTIQDFNGRLDYGDCSFDSVLCYNVLMEFPDITHALSELHRVLKNGGEARVVVVHPLYSLFVNDRDAAGESSLERLRRYQNEELMSATSLKGFSDFFVYRRPISYYVQHFIDAGFELRRMEEVYIPDAIAKAREKYSDRAHLPVFAYFVLRKI